MSANSAGLTQARRGPQVGADGRYEAAMAHARELVAERHQGVVVQHVNPDTEQIRERVEL